MKRSQREARERRNKPKKGKARQRRRLNPVPESWRSPAGAFDSKVDLFPFDWLTDSAGSLLVTAAIHGCTFQEKTIIAGLIPLVLPILRKGETISIDDALRINGIESQRAHAVGSQPAETTEQSANKN